MTTMTTTKSAQRIARAQYDRYLTSYDYRLSDVYDRYSQNKINAFEKCVNLMAELDGYGLKIISHNSNVFTVGFCYTDKITNEEMFAYITRDYNRACVL